MFTQNEHDTSWGKKTGIQLNTFIVVRHHR